MPTSASTPKSSLSNRLDAVPKVTPTQRKWFAILALLMIFEMADINAFAYAAPTLRQQWTLSVNDLAIISGAAFLGMSAGSVVGGALADRFGRKRLMVWGTVFYSVFSLASSIANGPIELTIYRFFIGAGLYTVTVSILTYVAEMFPQPQRGRVQALLLALALLGIPAMSWFSRFAITLGEEGWRLIFVLGSFGIIVAAIAARKLPESIRWQESKGRAGSADAIVRKLEHESGADLLSVTSMEVSAPQKAATVGELIHAKYLARTVVLSLMLGLSGAAFYGFNAWMPVLLTEHGFSSTSSLTYSSVLALAACPGSLVAMFVIDRFERRTTLMAAFLTLSMLFLVFGFTENTAVLLATGVVISFLLYASTAFIYTYAPEIYPTRFRALGTGIGNGFGRLSAFGAMFAVAAILNNLGFTAVFALLASVIALAGLVIGVLGQRTRGLTVDGVQTVANPTGERRDARADQEVT